MNCFLMYWNDGTIHTIDDISQEQCNLFRDSYDRVEKLIAIHSLFSYVRLAWNNMQNLKNTLLPFSHENRPLSEKHFIQAEKGSRDFLYHYMTYCDSLGAFFKKEFGRKDKTTTSIEKSLNSLEKVPEVSFVHSLRNYATHEGGVLSFVYRERETIKFLVDTKSLIKRRSNWEKSDLKLMKSYGDVFDIIIPFEYAYNELRNFHCLMIVQYINTNGLGKAIYLLQTFKQELDHYIVNKGDEVFFSDAQDENGRSVTREEFSQGKGKGFVSEWIRWDTLEELAHFLEIFPACEDHK